MHSINYRLYHSVSYDWDGTFAYASPYWTLTIDIDNAGYDINMLYVKPTERQIRQHIKAAKKWLLRKEK